MSKTVDERVVEMRFDNSRFEKNVQTSMSTLEKLKRSLNLTGASKGIEDVNKASKRFNLSGMGGAIETVQAKFSALEVVSITTLANITNSAVNAGKKIVSALTIEPVTTGFQEYETQINAVQTILANTQSKGSTLDDVNKALDELNTYADKTIYNFTEMTRNIGTFTAAGVDLDKSVTSIKGIANLAAVSGSTSQQASTAMYQLSQALAAGKVQLMDWNSVVNAGMGGQVFQDALKRTAKQMGYNVDEMIKKYGSFRESLTKGEWLTSDVLTETLTQLSGAYSKADLIAQGYSEKQAQEITELAGTAVNAATKVKTFTQLWDTLKEAAQSGWTQTWELIIGDFEESKEFLSGLSDKFGNIINNMSNARNELLGGALNSKWDTFIEKVNKAGVSTKDFKKTVKEVAKESGIPIDQLIKKYGSLEKVIKAGKIPTEIFVTALKKLAGTSKESGKSTKDMTAKLEKFQNVVNQVWNGDFKNGEERVKALTKAGYDYKKVQDLVNKTVDGHKLTLDDLSDSQLKNVGYTDKQIKSIRKLAEEAEKTGTPLNELIEDLGKPSGRELLIDSFSNSLKAVGRIIKAVSAAWRDIFPKTTSNQLYKSIEGFNLFTKKLVMSKTTAENLTRTLKGVFAIIDLITTITGGAFKIAFKIITNLLGMADVDILKFTASVGDAVVEFRNFVKSALDFEKVFDKIIPYLEKASEGIREWIEGFKDTDNIPKYIVEGLVNGLINGTKLAVSTVIELGKALLEGIKGILGIHSPSREFFTIGKNITQGLVNGIQNGSSSVWETIKKLGTKCIEIFKSIDFGKIFAVGLTVGTFVTINKLINTMNLIAAPAKAVAKLIKSVGGMFDSIGKYFKAKALEKKSKAILNIAIAIGVLAVSVLVLSKIPTDDLKKAGIALGVLAGVIVALAFASSKLGKVTDMGKSTLNIMAVSASLLILALAMKQMASITDVNMAKAAKGLTVLVLEMCAILFAIGKFVKADRGDSLKQAGKMLIKMSLALLLMVIAIKIVSKMDGGDIIKGIAVIAAVEMLFAGVISISKLAGKNGAKAGAMLLQMAIAFLILLAVIKIVSKMDGGDIIKGIAVIAALEGLFAGVIAVSKLAGKNGAKAGAMLLEMSLALMIIVGVIKQVSKMEGKDLVKGIGVISVLEILFAGIIAVSNLAGSNAIKAGIMLLEMSLALMAVTVCLFLIKKMDPSGLGKALGVITVLEVLFAGLIAVTHLAEDCKGTLITLTVAVVLLVGAVVGLSFIDPKKLVTATTAMTMLVGIFSLLVASTKFAGSFRSTASTLLLLVGIVAILGGIIVAIAKIDCTAALTSTTAITMLLIAMSTSLMIASKTGPMALAAVGSLALMGLVVAELAIILGLMTHFDVNPSKQTAAALSLLLISMSASLVLLGVVGTLGPAAFIGIAALGVLIAGVGGLVVAIGALTKQFPQLEEFLNTGIPILCKIGEAIGSFFGNIVAGFTENATNGLPDMGKDLSDFMENVKPFIEGAKTINEEAMTGVKALAETILILTGTDILNAISSFITGGSSLIGFGNQLVPFGKSMVAFSDTIAGVKPEAVTAVANAGKILAEMASSIPNSGLSVASVFVGDNKLDTFGEQLKPFANAMVDFSKIVSGNINEEAVTAAANAGSVLVKLAETVPNSGGLISYITGDNKLDEFGTQIKLFGQAIVGFSSIVSQKGAINEDSITAAANAGAIMVKLNETIPNSGGLISYIVGHDDLATFGQNMLIFGQAIVGFSSIVSQKGAINEDSITAAANAGAIMVKLQETIPKTGGVFGFFTGDNSLDTFGSNISKFGESIANFSSKVSGKINDNAIQSAANAGKIMASLQETLPNKTGWYSDKQSLSDFGSDLPRFGKYIAAFASKVKDVSVKNLNGLMSAIETTVKTVNLMKDIDTSGIEKFKEALSELGTISFDEITKKLNASSEKFSSVGIKIASSITKGLTSKSTTLSVATGKIADSMVKGMNIKSSKFMQCGTNLMVKFTSGVSKSGTKTESVLSSTLSKMVTKIRNKYQSFYYAGSYLVSGFCNGISANTFRAESKASAMAEAAERAARKELKINSPSKVFMKIGGSVPEGFAKGIDKCGYYVVKSVKSMSKNSLDKTKQAISNIASVLDTDIDTQPTIRPVVDLSNVSSSASAINSMLGQRYALGVASDVGAINAMMNASIQNGGNSDVISAIDKLRKEIGNVGSTTYQVNGVTYDDGSNISNAVKSLVRAAKIERRI